MCQVLWGSKNKRNRSLLYESSESKHTGDCGTGKHVRRPDIAIVVAPDAQGLTGSPDGSV